MTEATPDVAIRLKRICDVCGGFDDHPRHQIAYPQGMAPQADIAIFHKLLENVDPKTDEGALAVSDFFDTTIQLRHMDCCRSVGCPDGTCNVVTAGAEHLRGYDLLDHLQTREGETYFIDGRPESEVLAEIPQEG